jgi:penicillin-binding protein 1A
MDAILVKIFATALSLSQVTTAPEAVKTQFDPATDKEQVVSLLRAGCAHMRKAFDIESVNLDDLISTALEDPQALTGDIPAFKGINFRDMHVAYRQFCKNETVPNSPVDIGEVIVFYNNAAKDLPDHEKLRNLKLPGMSVVLDGKGARFAEVFEPDHRRVWVPLGEIPKTVQQAFIAAEDKRFHQHKGLDERSLIRAFVGNLASPGRPQGGSTITQQVAKNLLVGDDVTYDRKIREMIIATRLEQSLSKERILELYLNSVFFGRGAYGIEMAARSYFDKPAKDLNVGEGALLAGLVKGPNFFSPDRQPQRAQERLGYVLSRMQEDNLVGAEEAKLARNAMVHLSPYERVRRDSGFHFVDQVAREAKAVANVESLTAESVTVRSTIHPQLQRTAEEALQDGLAKFELSSGRMKFEAPEANLADVVKRIEGQKKPSEKPAWQLALENARLPLYDVHWKPAIVVEKTATKNAQITRIGLTDGRILPLSAYNAANSRKLNLHDVIYVKLTEGKGKVPARAELRVRPQVQGAVVALENKTGRILAMAGGFSYPMSQLNRVTQAQRQPGSAFKPFTYLAALKAGLQPNTLVRDTPLTLPPIGGTRNARPEDYWTPKNYDGSSASVITLRRALENSRNLATAQLLDGGIDYDPAQSLQRVCELAMEAQVYKECMRYYPFVLGAQPLRVIDLAAFYAAIANEGMRPQPYTVEAIEKGGQLIYQNKAGTLTRVGSADNASFYQLKTMLQGVLARGTARQLAGYSAFAAGKTGTTDDENDAWFVGFTNDVTIAVWVGYDNNDGKRRTLGRGMTGGKLAVPIFEPILQAAWAQHMPKVALAPPSPEARKVLVASRTDLYSGDRALDGDGTGIAAGNGIIEYFRSDRGRNPMDAQYKLVPREEATLGRDYQQNYGDETVIIRRTDEQGRPLLYGNNPSYYDQGQYVHRGYQTAPQPRDDYRPPQPSYRGGLFGEGGLFGPPARQDVVPPQPVQRQAQPGYRGQAGSQRQYEDDRYRQQRVDPDYFWRSRPYN